MSEHTPTPWRFDGDWQRLPTIYGADGKMVGYVEKEKREATPEPAANADLIIKAVNSHDALVKALEGELQFWKHRLDNFMLRDDALGPFMKEVSAYYQERIDGIDGVLAAVGAAKQP